MIIRNRSIRFCCWSQEFPDSSEGELLLASVCKFISLTQLRSLMLGARKYHTERPTLVANLFQVCYTTEPHDASTTRPWTRATLPSSRSHSHYGSPEPSADCCILGQFCCHCAGDKFGEGEYMVLVQSCTDVAWLASGFGLGRLSKSYQKLL